MEEQLQATEAELPQAPNMLRPGANPDRWCRGPTAHLFCSRHVQKGIVVASMHAYWALWSTQDARWRSIVAMSYNVLSSLRFPCCMQGLTQRLQADAQHMWLAWAWDATSSAPETSN